MSSKDDYQGQFHFVLKIADEDLCLCVSVGSLYD